MIRWSLSRRAPTQDRRKLRPGPRSLVGPVYWPHYLCVAVAGVVESVLASVTTRTSSVPGFFRPFLGERLTPSRSVGDVGVVIRAFSRPAIWT